MIIDINRYTLYNVHVSWLAHKRIFCFSNLLLLLFIANFFFCFFFCYNFDIFFFFIIKPDRNVFSLYLVNIFNFYGFEPLSLWRFFYFCFLFCLFFRCSNFVSIRIVALLTRKHIFFFIFGINFWFLFTGQKQAAASAPREEFKCPNGNANGNYADPVTCRRFYQVSCLVAWTHKKISFSFSFSFCFVFFFYVLVSVETFTVRAMKKWTRGSKIRKKEKIFQK